MRQLADIVTTLGRANNRITENLLRRVEALESRLAWEEVQAGDLVTEAQWSRGSTTISLAKPTPTLEVIGETILSTRAVSRGFPPDCRVVAVTGGTVLVLSHAALRSSGHGHI